MEALKNLCKTQNICLICTLHQSSSDVLSVTDFLYVLAKGGHNVFWGPTQRLKEFLKISGIIISNTNPFPIETLVSISAEGLQDSRLVTMKTNTNRIVMNRMNSNDYNYVYNTSDNTTKKFCYKDVFYLIQKELTEVLEFKYKFHLLDAILMITTSLLLANLFGTDIGKFDDCFGIDQNITCKQRQLSINMVEHNANYISILLLIVSFIRCSLTVHDKLIKTTYFYHNRQNS